MWWYFNFRVPRDDECGWVGERSVSATLTRAQCMVRRWCDTDYRGDTSSVCEGRNTEQRADKQWEPHYLLLLLVNNYHFRCRR
eukprot:m.464725 g.464725  ORF g.464725 m.464725 type:complete len:83 (+) comp21623_c0_seq1:1819-2067(+)